MIARGQIKPKGVWTHRALRAHATANSLSKAEFATRIDVSLETIRNWEQGKRCPTGAAKALLKVLDKAPEAALSALH